MIHLQQNLVSLQSAHAEADVQLERFFQQKSHIIHLQSHLDMIMENVMQEHSFISLVAQWYGSKSWWSKVYLGLSLAAISAVIGAVFNLALTYTALTSAVYVSLSYVFQNDYAVTIARNSRLRRDIQRMEAGLAASLQHVSELEQALTRVLTSIIELNNQMQGDIERFTQQIMILEAQVQQFSEVISSLEKSNASFSHIHAVAQAQFENTRRSLSVTKQQLSAESDELKVIHAHFDMTQQKIQADHGTLMHVSDSLIDNTQRMHECSHTLKMLIPKLQDQCTKNELVQAVLLEKLSSSVEKTLENQSLSSEMVGRAEATLNKAQQELHDFSFFYHDMEDDQSELIPKGKPDQHAIGFNFFKLT